MRTNKEKYTAAFSVLHASGDMLREVKEMTEGKTKGSWKKRLAGRAAATAGALILCAGTVFAAVKYLSPAEVSARLGNEKLERAFSSADAVVINDTRSFEDYNITLLGTVSGKDISDGKTEEREGEFNPDRTYAALAIERTDGKGAGEDGSFAVIPLIKGKSPLEMAALSISGGYSSLYSEDGKTEYIIVDTDNISQLTEESVYLAVQLDAPSDIYVDAGSDECGFVYDESTGVYRDKEDFDGVCAVFEIGGAGAYENR